MNASVLFRRFAALFAAQILFALILSGCYPDFTAHNALIGNGVIANERRILTDFHTLRSFVSANVEITCGEAPGLTIEIDENLLSSISTRVEQGELVISTVDGRPIAPKRFRIAVDVGMLKELELCGAGDLAVKRLDAPSFKAVLKGAGNINAAGDCDNAEYTIAGAGNINARECVAKEATANIFGAGNITVTALQKLKCIISGTGSVIYFGDPAVIERSITGAGSVVGGR
jgi:hypothetical protein